MLQNIPRALPSCPQGGSGDPSSSQPWGLQRNLTMTQTPSLMDVFTMQMERPWTAWGHPQCCCHLLGSRVEEQPCHCPPLSLGTCPRSSADARAPQTQVNYAKALSWTSRNQHTGGVPLLRAISKPLLNILAFMIIKNSSSLVQLNLFADIPCHLHLPPIKIKAFSQQIYLLLGETKPFPLHSSAHRTNNSRQFPEQTADDSLPNARHPEPLEWEQSLYLPSLAMSWSLSQHSTSAAPAAWFVCSCQQHSQLSQHTEVFTLPPVSQELPRLTQSFLSPCLHCKRLLRGKQGSNKGSVSPAQAGSLTALGERVPGGRAFKIIINKL